MSLEALAVGKAYAAGRTLSLDKYSRRVPRVRSRTNNVHSVLMHYNVLTLVMRGFGTVMVHNPFAIHSLKSRPKFIYLELCRHVVLLVPSSFEDLF